MSENNITAWTGEIAPYTLQGPTGLTFGSFSTWEEAQAFALANIDEMGENEHFIMRDSEILEIVQEDYRPLELVIKTGRCAWCNTCETEYVASMDGPICQECSGEYGYGENVWLYLRG